MNEESERDREIDLYLVLWLDLAMMLMGFIGDKSILREGYPSISDCVKSFSTSVTQSFSFTNTWNSESCNIPLELW
jgi:hypothetical protein